MAGFEVATFSGKAPKISAKLLPEDIGQEAINCNLESGQLRAWKDADTVTVSNTMGAVSSSTETIFLYEDADTDATSDDKWLSWNIDVDVQPSPIAEDSYQRIYWTGDSYPKYAANAVAITGTSGFPAAGFRLGLPQPSAPTIAITGTANADAIEQSIAYTYTFVSRFGEEGPPSTASAVVTYAAGQTRTLTLPASPTGSGWIFEDAQSGHLKRIYRTNSSGDFQFVADVAIGTTSYVDSVTDANLGEFLDTSDNFAPPDNVSSDHPSGPMKGLTQLSNGIMAGFTGNTICFSKAYKPHAWPTSYQLTTRSDIVGLSAVSDGMIVTTKGKPYLVAGTDPAQMSMMELDISASCVSKTSIVDMGEVAMYASPDGLVVASMNGVTLATEGILTRDQWQALKPSTIKGYLYEGKYLGFYNDGSNTKGFIFDPRGGKNSFSILSIYAKAGYNDLRTDTLYLMIGGSLKRFNASSSSLSYTWKSKKFNSKKPINMGAAQVSCASYSPNPTFKFYADGTLKHTQQVANNEPFRLPSGFLAKDFEFQLEGAVDVDAVCVYESASEIL